MALRSPILLAGAFLAMAVAYAAYFNIAVRVDDAAAKSRFDILMAADAPGRAARHGERALAMRVKNGADPEDLADFKTRLAKAQIARKKYPRAAELLGDALATDWAHNLQPRERIDLEDALARANLLTGNIEDAVAVYASFLELAGDAAAHSGAEDDASLKTFYAERLAQAAPLFTEALNYAGVYESKSRAQETQLAAANHMAALGGFYSMHDESDYAAAGLLSAAYQIRKKALGAGNQDTVQITLILGPVFAKMGRLDDAKDLYREALNAQENIKGANSPDLSLYMKLLADIYEQQGRLTEAQALYEHMRRLFRDAFGAQRYAVNRKRDRRQDINRPVSQYFLLDANYAPTDLVSAAEFSVPTGKTPNLDEMKLRLAADQGEDPREANLPARLAQLISLCRTESGERISLRSGYRSYQTQRILYKRNGNRGTVTPPGMSEHQTGLAADININGRFMRHSDRSYQCFEENAFRFGFILSYPPDNDYLPGVETHEPWHWRYVGVQTAQLYREAGPYQKPQEFLAALPCYQERAANGFFPTAGEPDICLSPPAPIAATAMSEEPKQPIGEKDNSARILNDTGKTRARR